MPHVENARNFIQNMNGWAQVLNIELQLSRARLVFFMEAGDLMQVRLLHIYVLLYFCRDFSVIASLGRCNCGDGRISGVLDAQLRPDIRYSTTYSVFDLRFDIRPHIPVGYRNSGSSLVPSSDVRSIHVQLILLKLFVN